MSDSRSLAVSFYSTMFESTFGDSEIEGLSKSLMEDLLRDYIVSCSLADLFIL